VEEHRFRASLRRLELSCNVDPGLPSVLSGDGNRLRLAVCHLLAHAVRSAPERRITVNVSSTPSRSGRVLLRVVIFDGGWPAALERSFDRRERIRSRADQGAAISLALADRIAGSLGGDVVVETAPD